MSGVPGSDTQESRAFVSYAREDRAFVEHLRDALAARGHDAWVDWLDIPPSAQWMIEVLAAIDAASAFVFVISPDSVASPVCKQEVEHAAAANKRIIPLLYRQPEEGTIPEAVAARNWIPFGDETGFPDAVDTVVRALEVDPDWVRSHTRMLVRAREWEQAGWDRSQLLRGRDLRAAEAWIARGPEMEPPPGPLQSRYVLESRRKATRGQRLWLAAALAVIAVLGVAVGVALGQRATAVKERHAAERQARLAKSRELASAAEAQLPVDPELSVLLSVQGLRRARTPEAEDLLRRSLVRSRIRAVLPLPSPIANGGFTRSGDFVVTVSAGGEEGSTIVVWDARSGEQEHSVPTGPATGLVFGPGNLFTTTLQGDAEPGPSPPSRLTVWDAASGAAVVAIDAPGSPSAGSFSPDGRWLATVRPGSPAVAWNLSTGAGIDLNDAGEATDAEFSPDGRTLATAGADGLVTLWDTGTWTVLRRLPGRLRLGSATFAPDGQHLLTLAAAGPAHLWALGSSRAKPVDLGSAVGASFAQDVATLNVLSSEGFIRTFDVRRGVQLGIRQTLAAPLAFSPDGRFALTAASSDAHVIAVGTGIEVASLAGSRTRIVGGEFSPDGTLALTIAFSTDARIWDTDTTGAVDQLEGAGNVVGASFGAPPSSRTLLTTQGPPETGFDLWDASTGVNLGGAHGVGVAPLLSAELGPAGAVVTTDITGRVTTWEGEPDYHAAFSFDAPDAVLSPDGGSFATRGDTGVTVRATATSHVIGEIPIEQDGVIALSPAGHLIAVGPGASQASGSTLIADVRSGRVIARLGTGPVARFEWSGDGRSIAAASASAQEGSAPGGGATTVWDARAGRMVGRVPTGVVGSLALQPGGSLVASTDAMGALTVWDVATREVARSFPDARAVNLSFSADGQYLVLARSDEPLLILPSEVFSPFRQVERLVPSRVTRDLSADERQRFHLPARPSVPSRSSSTTPGGSPHLGTARTAHGHPSSSPVNPGRAFASLHRVHTRETRPQTVGAYRGVENHGG